LPVHRILANPGRGVFVPGRWGHTLQARVPREFADFNTEFVRFNAEFQDFNTMSTYFDTAFVDINTEFADFSAEFTISTQKLSGSPRGTEEMPGRVGRSHACGGGFVKLCGKLR
jgi:hypothetical protein